MGRQVPRRVDPIQRAVEGQGCRGHVHLPRRHHSSRAGDAQGKACASERSPAGHRKRELQARREIPRGSGWARTVRGGRGRELRKLFCVSPTEAANA
eukprot:765110-Hanusia_phi.AAC.7